MKSGAPSKTPRSGPRGRLASLVLLGLGLGVGCAPTEAGGPGMEIRVTPLRFEPVLNVCYDLQVFNRDGNLLWQAGDPNRTREDGDGATICSADYGTGSGGDIQYIGPCDPSSNPNVVSLMIDGIYTLNGRLQDGTDWLPTCTVAEPCVQYVQCQANTNVLVDFDIVVMRDANQGFFDIAVRFDDVFCSAKVDCTYNADGSDPIMAVNTDGTDLQTVVVGLACTAGPDTATEDVESVLFMNDLRIQCGQAAGPQPSLHVYSCEDDSNTFYGIGMTPNGGAGTLQGFVATRAGASYDVAPFELTGMPGPYTIAAMQRILTDTVSPREGIVLMAEPGSGGSPVDGAGVALATNFGGGWTVSDVADNDGETTMLAQAFDGQYLITANSFDNVGEGARVLAYRMQDSAGARSFGPPIPFLVPDGLTECDNWQVRHAFAVATCRQRGTGPDGNDYDTFRGVLLVLDLVNAGNAKVLVPDGDGELRVSELDFAGLIRDDNDLVIAVNARFQWSSPPVYDNDDWTYDSSRYAVVWRCTDGALDQCEHGDPAVPAEEYRKHGALLPGGRETAAAGLVDSFLVGSFALELTPDSPDALPAVFEARGPSRWNRWYTFTAPDAKPAKDVVIHGMFPKSRVIYGSYGPLVPSVFAGYPDYQAMLFVAFVPEEDAATIQLIDIPIPQTLEVRDLIGRVGPDGALRLFTKVTGDGNGGPIDVVGQYTFRADFLRVKSLDFFSASSLFGPNPTLAEPWDFDSFEQQYARLGMGESTDFDVISPDCSQVFGDVVRPGGGTAALIADPALDIMFTYPPGDLHPDIDGGVFATADPLVAPAWLGGGESYVIIDPTTPEGYFWHNGDVVTGTPANPRPVETAAVLKNYAVYRGVEELECGAGSCNKLYWNVAIGFDPTVADCTLYVDTTAASGDNVAGDGSLPADAWWPWLQATVPLTGPAGGLTCTQHPMGSDAYPAVSWPMNADNQGCHRYDGVSVLTAPQCTQPEYWLRYREWAP